jgi:hypothetical protein
MSSDKNPEAFVAAGRGKAARFYLRQLAGRYLLWCFVFGVASFILFILAFQAQGSGPYGISALVLAGCCMYFNYKSKKVTRDQIARMDK